jgi:WD40 repeat protein
LGGLENVLVVSTDGKLCIVDIATSSLLKSFEVHESPAFELCSSPDGQWLAACCSNKDIAAPGITHIFSLDTLRHHAALPASLFDESFHSAFAFSPDSTRLVFARSSGQIFMFDVERQALDSKVVSLSEEISEKPIGITFNPADDHSIVIYGWDNITVINLEGSSNRIHTVRKFKPIMFSGFIAPDSLVIVEAPFVNTLKHLPDVIERERYGT